jgi:hypothetical protein
MAAGKVVAGPDDLDHLLKIQLNRWHDLEDACEIHHGKMRTIRNNAAKDFCNSIKPEHDAIVKRLVAALAEAQAAHLEYHNLRTDLRANDIGFFGICNMNFYELLGGPTDKASHLTDIFREAMKLGLLNKIPAGLRA